MASEHPLTILVAGASGYIGSHLISRLLADFPKAHIVALSRSSHASADSRVEWKSCDLFSLKSLEQAIPPKVDLAYYLVHSMGPTAAMDQGSFADYDLILADNFARALKSTGTRQLIYLGGLAPDHPDHALSLHLRSRIEVEKTFRSAGLPLTIFRAGLIVGESGSSFQILAKLVKRLPVMLCPKWTQTQTTPVDLPLVIDALTSSALREDVFGCTIDLAGCRSLTYVEMMRQTARAMHRRRYFLTVPLFTPTLSRLWVSLITGAPKELVYPLVASLEHPMVAREDHLFAPATKPYSSMLNNIDFAAATKSDQRASAPITRKTVRSIQRLPVPKGADAEWIKNQYTSWLPRVFSPIIRVITKGDRVQFVLFSARLVMLELTFSPTRSSPDRQLLYITGGYLATREPQGRLEFRVVLDRAFALAAIHDFKPSLPWFLYRFTQARLHVWVMRAFAAELQRNETIAAEAVKA